MTTRIRSSISGMSAYLAAYLSRNAIKTFAFYFRLREKNILSTSPIGKTKMQGHLTSMALSYRKYLKLMYVQTFMLCNIRVLQRGLSSMSLVRLKLSKSNRNNNSVNKEYRISSASSKYFTHLDIQVKLRLVQKLERAKVDRNC